MLLIPARHQESALAATTVMTASDHDSILLEAGVQVAAITSISIQMCIDELHQWSVREQDQTNTSAWTMGFGRLHSSDTRSPCAGHEPVCLVPDHHWGHHCLCLAGVHSSSYTHPEGSSFCLV
ncbi:hypothetical protein ABBQ38_014535 [Trebouxia sp. C0009 RCD-2024]